MKTTEELLADLKQNYLTYKAEYQQLVKYHFAGANVISYDCARAVLPAHYIYKNSKEHPHEYLTHRILTEYLKTNKGQRNNTVLFTSGGCGSGKTTLLKELNLCNEYSIICDTVLSDTNYSYNIIRNTLKHKYYVQIIYVHRDPLDAYIHGVIPRIRKREQEIQSLESCLETYYLCLDTFLYLFRIMPTISVWLINKTSTDINFRRIEEISDTELLLCNNRIRYAKKDLYNRLYAETLKAYTEGKITQKEFLCLTAG
jgi:hypothetical protein